MFLASENIDFTGLSHVFLLGGGEVVSFFLERVDSFEDTQALGPRTAGRRICAVQAFWAAGPKPWRRANSFRPSILIRRVEAASAAETQKKGHDQVVSFFLVTRRGFEPRTHCLKGSCSAD